MRNRLKLPKWMPMRIRRGWHWHVEQRWIMSRFNSNAIRPGDFYENCNYQPMLCAKNEYGDLTGVSLINGNVLCCSAFHCAPVKYSGLDQARAAVIEFDRDAEQRYREMTGMDDSLEERAARAKENAEKATPLTDKTW